eukprot:9210126-Lingulodinium_polyedra.AAC.1
MLVPAHRRVGLPAAAPLDVGDVAGPGRHVPAGPGVPHVVQHGGVREVEHLAGAPQPRREVLGPKVEDLAGSFGAQLGEEVADPLVLGQ